MAASSLRRTNRAISTPWGNPDGVDSDRLDPIFFDLAGGRQEQKRRFFGELFPDWTESGSGLRFADFFQRDRVHGFKGIVVIDPRSIHS